MNSDKLFFFLITGLATLSLYLFSFKTDSRSHMGEEIAELLFFFLILPTILIFAALFSRCSCFNKNHSQKNGKDTGMEEKWLNPLFIFFMSLAVIVAVSYFLSSAL